MPRGHYDRNKSASKRPTRRLLGGFKNPLTYDSRDPNYVYRVFNDVPGRLDAAMEAGYEVVESDAKLGDPVADGATPVGSAVTRPVGGGITGVLMRKPRDLYQEDMGQKQAAVDELEQGLKQHAQSEGHYGSVKINKRN